MGVDAVERRPGKWQVCRPLICNACSNHRVRQPSGCMCRTATLGAHWTQHDNFHMYRHGHLDIRGMGDEADRQQLWTGRAYWCMAPVDMRVYRNVTEFFIAAMPVNAMVMLETFFSACQTQIPCERLSTQKRSTNLITK
mgnify:CR=1 FL=1